MRELGWYERPGVKILEGKWQDFVESEELMATGGFDVIYTDTFSEDYQGVYRSSIPTSSITHILQNFKNSSDTYPTYLQALSRGLVSSMGWAPPVSALSLMTLKITA